MKPVTKTFLSWLTTIVIGSLISSFANNEPNTIGYFEALVIVSGIMSIPAMFVYHFVALKVYEKSISVFLKKIYLSPLAVLLIFGSVIFFMMVLFRMILGASEFGNSQPLLLLAACYVVPSIVCVLLFSYDSPAS